MFGRRRRDGRSGLLRSATTLLVVFLLALNTGCGSASSPPSTGGSSSTAAGRTWMSGAFLGGETTLAAARDFGSWRGRPTEALALQTGFARWDDVIASQGLLATLKDFTGQIVITVPLLPADGTAKLDDVAAGRYDDIFHQVAQELVATGRETAIVRVGPTANVPSLPWAVTVGGAPTYRAAARHVMELLKQEVPTLRTEWDVGCGRGLDGSIDRTAALTRLYPGDEVTDILGCVHFDAFGTRAVSAQEWMQALRPRAGVGLADVADFARQRGKQLAVPDWGLSNEPAGGGDDPAFITRMHQYFMDNADILAFENYYDDPLPPRESALWTEPDLAYNPRAAAEYQRLWALG